MKLSHNFSLQFDSCLLFLKCNFECKMFVEDQVGSERWPYIV